MPGKKPQSKPQCPRCGYDLRGVMGLWRDTCPLMGKCSECGLEIEWSYVLRPEKYEPRWCVEYSPGWKSVLKSSFKTYCNSFVPWRFWLRLQMSYPIRWKRLVFYLFALLLPYVMAYVLVQGTAAVVIRYRTQMFVDDYIQMLPQQVQRVQWRLINQPPMNKEGMTEEESNALVKTRTKQTEQLLAKLQQMQKKPPVISLSYPEAVMEAIFLPFAGTSFGKITPGLPYPYTAPINLHEEVINPPSHIKFITGKAMRLGFWSKMRNLVLISTGGFSAGLLVFILFPFTFILLPVSRRKAKVRWSHILRVTIYHFFIPSTLLLLSLILCIVGMAIPPLFDTASDMVQAISLWGIWIGIIIWWSVAIKRYLKMPHGFAVSILLCYLLALVLAVIGAIPSGVYGKW